MITLIEEKLEEIRAAAVEQQSMIGNELNANVDATNAAMARYSAAMKQAQAKRDEARAIEQQAMRELDTALTNSQSVQIAIIQQIDGGRMITPASTPAARKPKLVKPE